MLFEASTLASTVTVWLEALDKRYNIDARPVFESHGIDLERLKVPGARYPEAEFNAIIDELVAMTGDPCLGLAVGQHVRPTSIYALGYAWLASDSLRDALARLARFDRTISTGDHIELREEDNTYHLTVGTRIPDQMLPPAFVDAYFMAVVRLCQVIKDRNFLPLQVRLMHGDFDRAGDYIGAFEAPVIFDANADELILDRAAADEPLIGANSELAGINDQVAEAYLDSLDQTRIAHRVRELLVTMLPSGTVNGDEVAKKLARSKSALQRRLRSEGTSFSELRDQTRQDLALAYMRQGRLSVGEIAFLVGFSDQSNFNRAFRRWTGLSPREWRTTQ